MYTSGPDAADLIASAGVVLDPAQRLVLDGALGERPDGRWSAREVAVFEPRQNGKGTLIEARVLAGLFVFGERLIAWTAHEFKTAKEGFLRIRDLVEGTPALSRRVKRVWEGSGEEGIELLSGQRLKFLARSRASGRGFSGDLVILDEAQFLTDLQMRAILSTLSARPNPQVWYLGTPPDDPAAWIYGVRRDGESGKDRLAYYDWGLDLDLSAPDLLERMADRDLWYQANPALGIRIDEEFVADELARLGEGFAAERLGVWLPFAGGGSYAVITQEAWQSSEDPASRVLDPVAFAIDMTPERTWTSVAVAGAREDGRVHGEVVEHRRGSGWVVDRVVQLHRSWSPCAVVIDPASPAGSLIPDLAEAGVEVTTVGARECAQACGALYDLVANDRFRHLGQPELTAAVAGAAWRRLADAQAWDRRGASVDISPLVAVTLAAYGHATNTDDVVELEGSLMA